MTSACGPPAPLSVEWSHYWQPKFKNEIKFLGFLRRGPSQEGHTWHIVFVRTRRRHWGGILSLATQHPFKKL
uniref:Uncharacterized protein n=1 Tax=Physcomitrium patens TaxID=3218 RepID=A0A2K1JTF3_PHYPA|nr:hypothetical protein PHYPA_014581 [Physcomitrium patens]